MVSYWTVNVVLAVGTVVVLAAILYVYGRTYRRVATRFGLGLMAFAAILLGQNAFAAYVNVSLQAQGLGANVALPIMVGQAAQLVALLVLLRIVWE